jgi:hypothetical protein
MTPVITVHDNFLADPCAVREWAMHQDWSVAPEYQGHRYPGCIELPANIADTVTAGLSKAHGSTAKPSLMFARMSLAGESTPAWIHADSGVDEYAAVLYLTRPTYCTGGTAFWYHNELQWDRVPDAKALREQGVVWNQSFADRLNHDANDVKHWSMTGLIPMKYNRLLTFKSKLFHSRWPQQSLGTNYDNGRLIIAAFYS